MLNFKLNWTLYLYFNVVRYSLKSPTTQKIDSMLVTIICY